MRRILLFTLPVLFFIALIGWFMFGLSRDASLVPSALINKTLPLISAPSLLDNERVITIPNDIIGQHITLINIWASWCVPCKVEHPFLAQLATLEDVKIIGLNWKDNIQNAQQFLTENGNIYDDILWDEQGIQSINLGVYGVPETYVIDKKGVIRYKHVGPILPSNIDIIYGVINALR